MSAAGGILGEPNARISRAELKAVVAVLCVALPPVRLHVDNAQGSLGLSKGQGLLRELQKLCSGHMAYSLGRLRR